MICASILDNNYKSCIGKVNKYPFSEIRLDNSDFSDYQISNIFKTQNKTIITCRKEKFNDEKRFKIIETALISGANYVDIDISNSDEFISKVKKTANKYNRKVIVSYHNYDLCPDLEKLNKIIDKCFYNGAFIAKIACMVKESRDCARLLSLYNREESIDKRIISIGMGKIGKITRISSLFLGAPFMFSSINEDEATAPGQLKYEELSAIIGEISK